MSHLTIKKWIKVLRGEPVATREVHPNRRIDNDLGHRLRSPERLVPVPRSVGIDVKYNLAWHFGKGLICVGANHRLQCSNQSFLCFSKEPLIAALKGMIRTNAYQALRKMPGQIV